MASASIVSLTVREATGSDVPAFAKLDASYVAGRRILAVERAGTPPELTLSFRWRDGTPVEAVYGEYGEARLRGALTTVDLFLVAQDESAIAGLLI